LDKSVFGQKELIVFKCLKTKRNCLNSRDVKYSEEWIIIGGGYYYNRQTEEQAEIILRKDKV